MGLAVGQPRAATPQRPPRQRQAENGSIGKRDRGHDPLLRALLLVLLHPAPLVWQLVRLVGHAALAHVPDALGCRQVNKQPRSDINVLIVRE